MSKGFWAVIAVIAIVFGGILFLKSDKSAAPGNTNKPTSHIQGQSAKNITLVEYGDYQCPICESYYQPVKQVISKYSSQVKFQFRNLPLTQIHQNAFAGARAAEAAGLQNKFWEMHDLLYENQSAWSESSNPQPFFEQYAKQLKLNVNKFKTDFGSSQVNNVINSDITEFNKTKNELATPTFFLNGKKVQINLAYNVDNSVDIESSVANFSKVLDQAIAQADTTSPAGSQNPQ